MKYISTRGGSAPVSSMEAIKRGLAPDGGLYMPTELPALSERDFDRLVGMNYPERAADILARFLDDYPFDELLADCRAAYTEEKFPGGPAPLVRLDEKTHLLELWHGPTAAFKDMALQIMPRLLSRALVHTGEDKEALILVATSGDTGKAALEGYRDVKGVRILVFYPEDGVSRVQKLQMATQLGENVAVAAIRGNFDDAQTGVKQIFADPAIAAKLAEKKIFLSSANSINWGRLAPQIVYYVSAYCDLLKNGVLKKDESFDVTVPTGNFGNLFAAFLARGMGVPIQKFVCASNANNVLTEFLVTGRYDRNRPFHTTISPSMDILISSNLERLLFLLSDAETTASLMKELNATGAYTVPAALKEKLDALFVGFSSDDSETAAEIAAVYSDRKKLIDTHTAVAVRAARMTAAGEKCPMVVVSTASPYKFAADVLSSLTKRPTEDPLAALDELEKLTGTPIPYPLAGIGSRKIRFERVIDSAAMADEVLAFAAKPIKR